MKIKRIIFSHLLLIILISCKNEKNLTNLILNDNRLDTIQNRALILLSSGFNAGSGYEEIWIRDFNTFITASLKVHPQEEVKNKLLLFFKMQGSDGNIVDGMKNINSVNEKVKDFKGTDVSYNFIYSNLAPEWAAHKNTVETDQESSLIQAVHKYIKTTNDRELLFYKIENISIIQRIEMALEYILNHRWSEQYGLVIGATTIDWGDVQPENGWGVNINQETKWSIDIYDNAMYLIAINNFLEFKTEEYIPKYNWSDISDSLKLNIRKHLWDDINQKYIPHIYLSESPFSPDFNESQILYFGGSACAILAGINNHDEIININQQMLSAISNEKYATVGMTVYPPYPEKEFPNMKPYTYQNGGDWGWFGGRMIQALIKNGFVQEAYDQILPMINRIINFNGFYEWWDVRTGEGKGSGQFRGEAGVIYDAINALKEWANENNN